MQNNLLGAVRENLDYVSNIDPASYNVDPANVTSGLVWGTDHVGELWFDTTNTRWVNYHQDNELSLLLQLRISRRARQISDYKPPYRSCASVFVAPHQPKVWWRGQSDCSALYQLAGGSFWRPLC